MSRLEDLPNELFLQLFKYLSTSEIFRSFHQLNSRLNSVIQSLHHLNYSSDDIDHLVFPYVRTVIIKTILVHSLQSFASLRRLIVDYTTGELLEQLNEQTLPHLEYLSITHRVHPWYISDLYTKIFSNTFPKLQSSSIARIRFPENGFPSWSQTFSIRSLKFNEINASIFLAVLSACPNLSSLHFKLSLESPMPASHIISHPNLKQLMINMNADHWPWTDQFLVDYLRCLPHLEQFHISRSIANSASRLVIFDQLREYHWLASIIQSSHLSFLCRFRFDLHLNRSFREDWMNSSRDLKKRFSRMHANFYPNFLMIFCFGK